MLGISTALSTVGEILNVMSESPLTDAELKQIEKIENIGSLVTTNGSITKLLSKFVIEPVLICSKDVKQTSIFDSLAKLNMDIFTAFYMQAFQILKDVYNLDTRMTFDVLSTDNSISVTSTLKGTSIFTIGKEDGDTNYGMYKDIFNNDKFIKLSFEADNTSDELNKDLKKHTDDNLYGILQKTVNVNINVKDTGQTIQIPVTIKAYIIVTDINNIVNMLKPNARDKSFSARYDEWRAGAITLKELIFCGDIIKEYKNNRIKDKDGLTAILAERSGNAKMRALETRGMKGFEQSYNMLLLTSTDKVRLENHIGGSITNEKFKQKLLKEANAMCLSLADDDYERVTILTADIRGTSDVGYKALSKRKDNNGSEMAELLKSLLMSRPMSF